MVSYRGAYASTKVRDEITKLDAFLSTRNHNGIITTGIRYARWLVFEGDLDLGEITKTLAGFPPDHTFIGKVLGKQVTVFMFIPTFPTFED